MDPFEQTQTRIEVKMAKEATSTQELSNLSTAEINHLPGGRFSDHAVITALHKLSGPNGEALDKEKELALLKLIWRSPEVDDYYAYDQILFNLMDSVIERENGKDFLVWAVIQVILNARYSPGFLAFLTYWDYARGFLYQGYGQVFARFLDKLLTKTPIPDNAFRLLIEDTARLGAQALSQDLQSLAEARYADQWQTVPIEELMPPKQDPETAALIDADGQKSILELLSTESLAEMDEDIEMDLLIGFEEAYEPSTEDLESIDLLLSVPDMIWGVFHLWEKDRDSCLYFLKALNIMREILPELACLGDLLGDEHEEAFIFDDFGKTAGFTFNSVKSFAMNPEYNIYLRANAAKALMQIPSKAPHTRGQAIKILEELLLSQETDPDDDEIKCSFLAADLLDTDLYELKPALTRVFQEDRVDPQVVGLESFREDWSLSDLNLPPPPDEQSIFLKCNACGRTRSHAYRALFFDINSVGHNPNFTPQEFFLDHPVICSKCGAEEAYSVEIQTMLKFIPPGFFTKDGEESINLLHKSVYLVFSERLFLEGLSPFLLSTLRKKVIEGGLEALDDLERGEYDRVTGHFQPSLAAFRKFHEEHPDSQIGVLALAMAEHDYGDQDQAKILYQCSLALEKGNALSRLENPRYITALQGLKALEQGERSPYLYPLNKHQKSLLDQKTRTAKKHKRH